MTERPSPFHKRVFVGKSVSDSDENGYKWSWDSTHPDITPTSTFKVGYRQYCSHCGEVAMPIQAHLREVYERHGDPRGDDYETTGYTCGCEGSIQERAYENGLKEMQERHRQELQEYQQANMPDIEERQRPFEYQRKREALDREYSDVQGGNDVPRVVRICG